MSDFRETVIIALIWIQAFAVCGIILLLGLTIIELIK